MLTHRFGRKIKLPSTVAIKHQILKLMLHDHLKAQALNTTAIHDTDDDGRELRPVDCHIYEIGRDIELSQEQPGLR